MGGTRIRRHAGNIPADPTSFVGRRHDIAAVKRLLASTRMVTLTGVGGVGKTRLALRLAEELQRAIPDGAWFTEFGAVHQPELLAETVAAALGMQGQTHGLRTPSLSEYLADRELLLVLDNCEHVVESTAKLVDALLRACPALRVLATSRQPLGIAGESTYPVPPLPVPDRHELAPPPEALAGYDSVALFVERARTAVPDFEITADNHSAVTALCQRLDGLPLALELAAVRLRLLSPEQIVARLDDRYRLLTAGSPAAQSRQQSLRALVDWSFDLCTADEQTLWARLSVFPDSFDVDAAELICSGDGLAEGSILEVLAGLVDKSIIAVESREERSRYRMLESIRQYGLERLELSGRRQELRARHRDYYRQLAEQAWDEWFSARQLYWSTRLRREHGNLRSALETSLADPDGGQPALWLAVALVGNSLITGSLGEGHHWLERALGHAPEPTPLRAKALWVDGWLALAQGDIPSAESKLTASRTLAQQLGDAQDAGQALVFLGMAAILRGDLTTAATICAAALDEHRALGHDFGIALAAARLATVSALLGETAQAMTFYEEAVAASEARGESRAKADAMLEWSLIAWQDGQLRRASTLAAESLRIERAFTYRLGIAHSLEVLAWIAASQEQRDRAAQLLGAAHAIWEAIGASYTGHLLDNHDRCITTTRAALGDTAFQKAFEHGAGLSSDEVISYALGEKAKTPPPPTPSDRFTDELTRREHEIAELVAQGLSNREIAARLVISPRTAEGHVEHILAKLGFTSRAQVAAWVVERQSARAHGEH